ncbi:DNA-binding protein, partial [Bacteroides ovatus]
IHTDKRGILFRGSDLIAYKEAGLPRRGRKFKNSPRE